MTLQNGLRTSEAAYLWSDTACYDFDGQFSYHDVKLLAGESFAFAFIHSGMSDVGDRVAQALAASKPATYPALVETVVGALKTPTASEQSCAGGERVLIASFDDCPRLTLIADKPIAGYPAFAPLETRKLLSGESEAIHAASERAGADPDSMLHIIETQALEPLDFDSAQPVAGNIMRATVTRDRVELSLIAVLPDPTGTAGEAEWGRVREGMAGHMGEGVVTYAHVA
ncbi:MAG: hypothetical protein AAGB23_07610 [Pseudomonadota bacterium]